MISTNKALFKLGDLTITESARILADKNHIKINGLLDRHKVGDWGDLSETDKSQNDLNLMVQNSVLSVYKIDGGTIQILTSQSKSQTFVYTEKDLK